uniref:Phospholipase A2 n=1 Tax=Buteo japonicus TaxID=224669 RepID=A0A8C0AP44_9AVES
VSSPLHLLVFKTSPVWYQFGGQRDGDMITKATGKNALLYYSSYGCYCGFGGKGQPKDATDRCCQLHDTCYDNLLSYHCNPGLTLSFPLPAGQGSWCAQLSCECDRSLVLCLKQSLGSYSTRYRFYWKRRC